MPVSLLLRAFAITHKSSTNKITYKTVTRRALFSRPPLFHHSAAITRMSSTATGNAIVNPRKRHEDEPGPGNTKKPRRRRNNNNNKGGNGNSNGIHGNAVNSNNKNRNRHNNKKSNGVANGDKLKDMDVDDSTPVVTVSKDPDSGGSRDQFSNETFASEDSISAKSKRALIEVLGYEYMTKVQEATLPSILKGKDIVAKAKTGAFCSYV